MVGALRLDSDAACLLTPEGRISWVNAAYAALTGFEAGELLDCPLCDLLEQRVEDRGATLAIEAALEEARELRIDMRFLPKTGDAFWVVIELHPIRDAHSQRLLAFAVVQIDIDRQRRERDLTRQASRERQALLDILDKHALVTETDLSGAITRVNQRFVEVSGYTEAELLGRNHHIVSSRLHGDQLWREVWSAIRQGKIWQGEICNRRKDGSLYWVDSVIAPMLDSYGRPERYVSIRTDITALKRSRDMLSRTGRVAGIGGWYCNLQSRTLYFTEAARRILCLGTDNMPADKVLHHLLPGPLSRALLEGIHHVESTGSVFSGKWKSVARTAACNGFTSAVKEKTRESRQGGWLARCRISPTCSWRLRPPMLLHSVKASSWQT